MTELKELPEVAKSLPYPCKKCDGEKYHRVLVHKTSTSAQIECEHCGSKKTLKIGVKKKVTRKKRAPKNEAPEMWAALNEKVGTEKIKLYKMSDQFEENQALDHPTFGTGYVTKALPKQIEVVFPEVIKILVHNY